MTNGTRITAVQPFRHASVAAWCEDKPLVADRGEAGDAVVDAFPKIRPAEKPAVALEPAERLAGQSKPEVGLVGDDIGNSAALSLLQFSNYVEKVPCLRITFRAEHIHQALCRGMRPAAQYLEPDGAVM